MASPSTPDRPPSVTASMYSSGKYSDMTIICKGTTFKVHQCIVCLQSKPLAAAMDGNFKEGTSNVINLEDDQPEIVEKMLSYMYTSDYSDQQNSTIRTEITVVCGPGGSVYLKETTTASTSNLVISSAPLTNAQVFVIADKYDVQGLKELAEKKYEEAIAGSWNSASFVASLKLLYEETLESDRALKDAAAKVAGQHARELVDRGEFAALCKEHGQIAFDVLKSSILEPAKPAKPSSCRQCGCAGQWFCKNCRCHAYG
ncbi:BTB and MATH domain-containing protein 43 [Lachnellula cervina]|uniref:BTB and MATH domain-containing protein 43 n=1 Tax=Lachnellula cervina TaxID=1316786 RepID=A0A7D8YYX5_9HELO|nr:BTB and MATH domain-containing protein 43 [Lachnellula cervina]